MLMNELFTKYDEQCIPELMPRSQRDYRGILVLLRSAGEQVDMFDIGGCGCFA
jgi:hypothetical protein